MPCEGCHIQFTVFKRKRSCYDCKRYYCHNCLVNSNNNRKYALCERCLLFNKRPLVRSDLVKLKPKDLIFYLQSKHISTAGCVEKEELIDLVLQYVNGTDINNQLISGGSSSGSSSSSSSHHTTPKHQDNSAKTIGDVSIGDAARSSGYGATGNNSFDSIKQTCQNFFSSLGDNISDSLANLESRACAKNRPSTNVTISTNVTEQPRVTTRVIPAYASSQQTSPESPIMERPTCASSSLNTVNLLVDLPPPTEETEVYKNSKKQEECECSEDEEIFASFNGRIRSPNSELEAQNLPINRDEYDCFSGTNKSLNMNPFNDCAPSMSSSKAFSQNSKLEIYANDEESSHSSFEELGAIGGISDDSKTNTDTTSNTTDHWQILDLKINETETAPVALRAQQQQQPYEQDIDKSNSMCLNNLSTQNMESHTESSMDAQEQVNHPPPTPSHVHPTAVKNCTRRRSESYITTTRFQPCANGEGGDVKRMVENTCIEEKYEMPSNSSTRIQDQTKRCCTRCGKNKANIRQQVEKMRQHLESSQMSETDIKQELSEFLTYLEQRTKSIEYSDSEAGVSTASVSRNTNEVEEEEGASVERLLEEQMLRGQTLNRWTDLCDSNVNKSDGTSSNFNDKDSRFINIDEIESTKQLEGLTVKQLKEVLMLHRVDYKGCCEKQELLDRVERLWKNLKSTPAVEKLPTDELCKICMDAPIECVILECGHMATCTNCGKVLSECPICRQYIVRVVRFFRA